MRLSLLVTLQFFFTFLFSQDNTRLSLFDTLYKEKNIIVRLTYPFDSLYKTNNDEIDARISITSDSGCLMKDAPLTINLRGKFRRMKCTMPPLLLNFKKTTLKELNLKGIDEIKLVTHCIEGEEGHQNLEEERLIYQLYETLTPFSYRTIWLTVEYCNMTNPTECITSVGFFLEPDKVISSRLGIMERKMFNMDEDSLHFDSYALATAFNFLIGNRDWSIISSRNAKLFYNPDSGKYLVIPYDFDYSNIVGAKYRRETLGESMTHPFDRIYFGEYFKERSGQILKSFYDFRQALLDAVNNAKNPIDAERRKKICKYFEHWFDMVKRSRPEGLPYGTVCPYKGGL
jgi:hypothetical protein